MPGGCLHFQVERGFPRYADAMNSYSDKRGVIKPFSRLVVKPKSFTVEILDYVAGEYRIGFSESKISIGQ